CSEQTAVPRREHDLIVGDEDGAPVDEPEREIGLAGTRGTGEEDGAAPDGNRGRVEHHCAAGRLTVKPAPIISPRSIRFSAAMLPSCASTMALAMARPRPECLPNASPSGRSE